MVPASLAPTPGRIGGPGFYPLREGSAGLELINSGAWLHCGEHLQRVLEFVFWCNLWRWSWDALIAGVRQAREELPACCRVCLNLCWRKLILISEASKCLMLRHLHSSQSMSDLQSYLLNSGLIK